MEKIENISVHEQVRKYQLSVISAVKYSQYSLIKYQLDQLRRLHDLLNQEYIEQIYTGYIRHLSKHLSEEYQEGTSMLNRCLMHQTVFTDDDIKQYQAYIGHANFPEKLRDQHLDNEVVHSSTFIQYLNQQGSKMNASLREKEIDW